MKSLLDIMRRVNEFMQTISAVVLTFMITLTTADVILRAFGRPILGTYEVVAICGGIVIGFGVPITSWLRGHIAVDFAVNKLPDRGRNIVNIITRCVAIGLCILISWQISRIGVSFQSAGEVSNTLELPLYPVAYGIAACFSVLAIVLFCDIVKVLGGSYE